MAGALAKAVGAAGQAPAGGGITLGLGCARGRRSRRRKIFKEAELGSLILVLCFVWS